MTRRNRTALSIPIEEEVRVAGISSPAPHPRMVWLLQQQFGWHFSDWSPSVSSSQTSFWAHYRAETEEGHTLLLTALRTGTSLPAPGMKHLDYLLAMRGDPLAPFCEEVIQRLKGVDSVLFSLEIPWTQLKTIPPRILLF
ncbi:MAG: hypothetical protein AB7C90_02010 [Bacteroidales bacterium]